MHGDFRKNWIFLRYRYIEIIPFGSLLWYSQEIAFNLTVAWRQISCQTTNYQFFVKYCRYFLDTCTISYRENACQIKMLKMVIRHQKRVISKCLKNPSRLGYNLSIPMPLSAWFLIFITAIKIYFLWIFVYSTCSFEITNLLQISLDIHHNGLFVIPSRFW